jgi:hypothetical protein
LAETHESFDRGDDLQAGSDRSFGLVIGVAFAVIGVLPLVRGDTPHWWSLALAGAFLGAAAAFPPILAPLNRLWHRLGRALHAVVSPVVMALLFYTTVTPTGLLMRALGKDLLRLRFDPDAPTYWIERRPPGPSADTMPRQF